MPNTFRVLDILRMKKSCKTLTMKPFKIEHPAIVSKNSTISGAVKTLGILREIKKNETVLIKPNINSDDVYPGTSRVEGILELAEMIRKRSASVSIGDMSSAFWHNTKTCAEKIGLASMASKEGIPLVFFEDYSWNKIELPNTYLGHCYVTSALCDFDHLVNLSVLKTHRLSDFTVSMKNLMGCLHLRTRMRMHTSINFKEMIGEFQRAITPLVNIVDGTKCFIDGGPDKGELREPGMVLASKDRVALDATCVEELKRIGSKSLRELNPWMHPQIIGGIKSKIGISSADDIKII